MDRPGRRPSIAIGSRLATHQLDAGFLKWDIRRFARVAGFPADRRVVVHFELLDARAREQNWWLVVQKGIADLCRDDPGHEFARQVVSTVRALTVIWTGDRSPDDELRSLDTQVLVSATTPTLCGSG